MESKRKNVYIVIFVITTIIASCVAVYFGIIRDSETKELQSKVDDLIAKSDNQEKKEETTLVDENVNNKEIEVKEKIVEKSIIPKYDISKIKNKPDNVEYDGSIEYSIGDYLNISIVIEEDGSLKVKSDSKEIKISGINEKIIDVCGGTLGDGAVSALAFLSENGNVYWATNIDNATNKYQGTGIINAEKVSDISNICKLVRVYSRRSNIGISRNTIIAIDTNGDCYDLWYAADKK